MKMKNFLSKNCIFYGHNKQENQELCPLKCQIKFRMILITNINDSKISMNDYKKLKLIEEKYFRKLPAIKLLIHSLVKVISKDNLNSIM